MLSITVKTKRLAAFGIAQGQTLHIRTDLKPRSGDLVYFRSRGCSLIGLLAGNYVLRPERPFSVAEVVIMGVALLG